MTDPILWPLGKHSPGKHLVLKRYLDAWLPILGTTQGRILFVDGFSGPGEYSTGETGSPIIALNALKNHSARAKIDAEVQFFFVDSDRRRIEHLRHLVRATWPERPSSVQVHFEVGKFDETLAAAIASLDAARQQLAPAFVMADPFGISDTPMEVFQRILKNDKSEVYISFMWEHINRFKGSTEFEPHLDRMFGTPRWREGIDIEDTKARCAFLFDLYASQLRAAGAKYVVRFDLYEGNRLKYAIFFGTKHAKACDRMKQAIWAVAPFGDFSFRGVRGGQLGLALHEANLDGLASEILNKFHDAGWVSVDTVAAFCQSDETDFTTSHHKGALRLLERQGLVEVDPTSRTKRGTFPDGTRLRFLATELSQ